jgi:hypothetical protein
MVGAKRRLFHEHERVRTDLKCIQYRELVSHDEVLDV